MKNYIILLCFILLSLFSFQNNQSVNITLEIGNYDTGIVKRQIDGDSLVIIIDDKEEKVRLLGVDTPESVHPTKPVEQGQTEQSKYTKESLTNKRVYLTYDEGNKRDFFGRLLQYIWIVREEDSKLEMICFNKHLIEVGHGKLYDKYKFELIDFFKE